MPENCPINYSFGIFGRTDGSGVYDMTATIKCAASETCPVLSLRSDEGLGLSASYDRDLDMTARMFKIFVNMNILAIRGECVNLLREPRSTPDRRGL